MTELSNLCGLAQVRAVKKSCHAALVFSQVQERRVDTFNGKMDMMDGRLDELEDKITETSNETSVTHDYCSGIRYAVVESGGFLRNGLGLSHDQWIHLNTLERANMVSPHAMALQATCT